MSAIVNTEIRGTPYRLARMDPLRGGRLAARVASILAAALADAETIATVLDTFKNGDASKVAESFLDQPQLLAALAGGVKNLDAQGLYDCAIEFARGNLFAGERKLHDDTAFNAHFAANPSHQLLVLVWVVRENCAGFFGLGAKA